MRTVELSFSGGVCHSQFAEALYVFLSGLIDDTLYNAREQLCETGNGFEMWRRYGAEYRGAEKEVQEDGELGFLLYPRCDNLKDLGLHLDKWETMRRLYCNDIPEEKAFNLHKKYHPRESQTGVVNR